MNDRHKLKILATIPSGFCFGLQHVTVALFSRFPSSVQSHFLLTKWSNNDLKNLLIKNNIPYSYSWLGMFSRKMDWPNFKMTLGAILKLPRLYMDFIRLQKSFDPGILYFANHHELILLYPVLLFTKRKVVCHMHDPAPAIPFQKKMFKKYDKIVDHYIAISDNVRLRTIELGCNESKIETIYNGIEISSGISQTRLNYFCELAGWSHDVFIIGITGQMSETKGYLDLVESFRIVNQKNPQARLVLGGKAQQPFQSEVEKKITALGLEKCVLFSGWLEDISVFFQNINLFVLASQHDEGYGLVVAEAMMHQLPVVITNSGGATEIVEDGIHGFIVSKRDLQMMADKILQLSFAPGLCVEMGNRGKEHIEKNFSLHEQAEKLYNVLLNLQNH